MLKIPAPQLYAGILVFATIGSHGISQSPIDLVMLYPLGATGFLMRRFDFPTAPVIIGMILGPLAEAQFRRAMTISKGIDLRTAWTGSSASRRLCAGPWPSLPPDRPRALRLLEITHAFAVGGRFAEIA